MPIYNNVYNQKNSPALWSSALADFPAPGYAGRWLIATDTFAMYYDNGTSFDLIGGPGSGTVTGTGSPGQVSFWSSASVLSGDNGLFWDNTNKRLGIGTVTPGVKLDIHGSGIMLSVNGTGTNNAYISFQNAGTTKYSIGNTYNGGSNDFLIRDVSAGVDRLIIAGTTGVTVLQGSFTANSLIKSGGTSNQFLKADGSIDSNTYITGNQTITLSGNVTGSGATSIATTIANGVIVNQMLSGIASNIANGVVVLGNGTGGFTFNTGVNWDGTYFNASNFLTGGKYFVAGSSGGQGTFYWDGSNTVLLKTDFDNLTIQAGINNLNKRQIDFNIGATQAAYIDINGDSWRSTSLLLTDNSKKFATTEFVKGQGYVTTAVTSVSAGTGISVSGSTAVTVTNTGTLQTTTDNGKTTTNDVTITVGTTADALTINKTGTGYGVNVSGISSLSYTAAMSTASQFGVIANLIFNGANATNSTQAVYSGLLGQMAFTGSGAATFNAKTIAAGVIGKSYFGTVGGSYNKAAGVGGSLEFRDNVNVTTAATLFALAPYVTASNSYSGVITNYCGLYLDDVRGNTDISAGSITNSYGIYQAGANDSNYLNGKTLIGTTTSSGTMKLQVSGNTYVSGQQYEGYSLRSTFYKSFVAGTASTYATVTGSNSNIGLHRVIVEYSGSRNIAGTLVYQSGRITAFFRIGVGTLGLSSTDILGTNFITFNYSLSGSVLTLTADPGGSGSDSFLMSFQITVITDGTGTGLSVS